jgi:F-type H+/Na+-transporting ATPase subunit alpha
VEEQVALIYAGTNGFLDSLPLSSIPQFVTNLQELLFIQDRRYFQIVNETKKLTPEAEKFLKDAIQTVVSQVS